MYHDLTKGSISRSLLLFALPMMAGNLLQQFYNIADTLIVGRVLGKNALAAVGSSYTLMTFLTSIFLGLSMGSGALFSIYRGKGDERALKSSIAHACGLILAVTLVLNAVVYIFIDPILSLLRVPEEVWGGMREYLLIIFAGLLATSLYNFFSCLLRALGNSTVPLMLMWRSSNGWRSTSRVVLLNSGSSSQNRTSIMRWQTKRLLATQKRIASLISISEHSFSNTLNCVLLAMR